MTTRTRMNVYFSPDLLKQVEALALRRNVSKSAMIEAAVASFLSGDRPRSWKPPCRAAWTSSAARSTCSTKISPSSARRSRCSYNSGSP
jgi:predicted transcriptional regulator